MTSTNDDEKKFKAAEPPRPPFWANARPVPEPLQPVVTTELAYVIYQLPNREKDR